MLPWPYFMFGIQHGEGFCMHVFSSCIPYTDSLLHGSHLRQEPMCGWVVPDQRMCVDRLSMRLYAKLRRTPIYATSGCYRLLRNIPNPTMRTGLDFKVRAIWSTPRRNRGGSKCEHLKSSPVLIGGFGMTSNTTKSLLKVRWINFDPVLALN